MNSKSVSMEELNAYVDGELDASDCARVARAVAEDPDLARRVAVLTKLRSVLKDSVQPPTMALPEVRAPRRLLWNSLAAGIALVLVVAGLLLGRALGPANEPVWLTQAWTAHDAWTPGDSGAAVVAPVVADPARFVPDLSAAKLRVAALGTARPEDRRARDLIGYAGTRGCKISLIRWRAPDGMPESLSAYHRGARLAYAWRAGEIGHVLLAEGMDTGRFQLIAETLRDATVRRLQPDSRTRVALYRSRTESKPCLV
jgi:anti-sigma factor RsiW